MRGGNPPRICFMDMFLLKWRWIVTFDNKHGETIVCSNFFFTRFDHHLCKSVVSLHYETVADSQ